MPFLLSCFNVFVTHVILAETRDYAVELNNFLQGHPTGNLTKFFQYVMAREGRDDEAPTYIATAQCEHHHHESKCDAVELIRCPQSAVSNTP